MLSLCEGRAGHVCHGASEVAAYVLWSLGTLFQIGDVGSRVLKGGAWREHGNTQSRRESSRKTLGSLPIQAGCYGRDSNLLSVIEQRGGYPQRGSCQ